ncbi:alpha/beta fold hydrolase [Pseudidiomarina atlantica]|uniref:alpha/beta fold hydrolase n=1 Tax=Pseudidiomarina atlantica TaxID=1517416 RepID=UPI001FCB2855|nr:alpha/beta hydrolase [Pseudidiomarina atlantica]
MTARSETMPLPQGFYRYGTATGAKILLLHSSQSNSGQWRELIQRLTPDYDVLAVDLLGYGKAPAAEVEHSDAFRFTDEVPRILDGVSTLWGDTPVILVGHSYGGALALKLALEKLLPVSAVAVYEPVAFHILDAKDPARAEIETIATETDQADAMLSTEIFVDYWNRAGYFRALPNKVQQLMASQAHKVSMDFAALMGEPHKLVDYRLLDCPVLLLTGSESRLSAQTVAAQLQQVLPQVKVEQVSCGHMGPLTHPQLVNPLLVRFIRDHASAVAEVDGD